MSLALIGLQTATRLLHVELTEMDMYLLRKLVNGVQLWLFCVSTVRLLMSSGHQKVCYRYFLLFMKRLYEEQCNVAEQVFNFNTLSPDAIFRLFHQTLDIPCIIFFLIFRTF